MVENEARKLVDLSDARKQSEESGTSLVPQTSTAALVEVESDQVRDVASALAQLQAAIAQMSPDDVSFEYREDRSASRSSRTLRLRAYRKG